MKKLLRKLLHLRLLLNLRRMTLILALSFEGAPRFIVDQI